MPYYIERQKIGVTFDYDKEWSEPNVTGSLPKKKMTLTIHGQWTDDPYSIECLLGFPNDPHRAQCFVDSDLVKELYEALVEAFPALMADQYLHRPVHVPEPLPAPPAAEE